MVVCPACDGKPVITPREPNHIGVCKMCLGAGEVNPDWVCKCGRPAIRVIREHRVCSSNVCAKEVPGGKPLPLSQTNVTPTEPVLQDWPDGIFY